MSKIITIKDKVTQESVYPITSIDAVVLENGQRFSDKVNSFFEETTITLENTITLAQAAEDTIIKLTNLNNTEKYKEEINLLLNNVIDNKQRLVTLEQEYKEIKQKLINLVEKTDLTNDVTNESTKIPTGSAVRNYVTNKTLDIVDSIINTTNTVPEYTTNIGQILINEDTNEVFIASANSSKWVKLNTIPIHLESVGVDANIINNNTVEITGNYELKNSTVIVPNTEKVEDDTLIF